MVTNITMHDFYAQELEVELKAIIKEIEELEVVVNKLKVYFDSWELSKEFNYKLAVLLRGEVESIESPISNKERFFNTQLKTYNRLYTVLHQKIGKRKELETVNIPVNIFCFILLEFNKRLIRKMIYSQYRFSNLYIGDILVVPYNYKEGKLAVDWPKSKKNRADILERGEEPYLLANKKQAIKEGKGYKGVEWLEYFPSLTLLFGWEKAFKNFARLAESKNFIFRASRGQKKNAPIKQLALYKNTLTKEDYKTLYNFDAK
jgi:hypothetical protein